MVARATEDKASRCSSIPRDGRCEVNRMIVPDVRKLRLWQDRIATEVANELLARVAGKRTVAAMGRKVPIIGGGFGAVTDGYATYQVGRYAAKELRSRRV